jgi:phenylpropionate dioxygenase-like ring-hydroxylating dioxygenase large terminal subunit
MAYLRNRWYVACWSEDLTSDPLARTFLDEPVALYRAANGAPVALEDRCCHRSAPLSIGSVEGDNIRCGYHGLVFGPSGACVSIPGQSQIPPGAKVQSYPVREKWGAVWIWPGAPDAADPALIPNVFWLDDPGWIPAPGYINIQADYRLLVDNLLDLTHVSYLHRSTLAGDDVEAITPVATTRNGESVTVERWIMNVSPPPLYTSASGIEGIVDRWQLIEWQAPANVYFDIGCARAGTGAPQGDRGQGVSMWSTHLITPETETSSHYHFSFARDYALDDEGVTEILRNGARSAFLEDLAVLEAQQRSISAANNPPPIDINIDNAPLQARRILSELIEAEAGIPR